MGPECFEPLWKFTEILITLVVWIISTVAGIGMLGATFAAIYYGIRTFIDDIKG